MPPISRHRERDHRDPRRYDDRDRAYNRQDYDDEKTDFYRKKSKLRPSPRSKGYAELPWVFIPSRNIRPTQRIILWHHT